VNDVGVSLITDFPESPLGVVLRNDRFFVRSSDEGPISCVRCRCSNAL
jgi:hypothetical protein